MYVGGDIYYLNKIMNSVDWFYTTELPPRFYVEHPVGSVMGKAKYGQNFFFYQGCTVGVSYSIDGEVVKPTIGNNVLMLANSSILGDSAIGNNVILAANAVVLNEEVPGNSLVFGQSPNLVIKIKDESEIIERLSSITQLNYK
jgi:serine O-acetyltransferase